MKLTFLGANHEVTGSCTLLEAAGQRYLIDCGMEQGKDIYENQPIPVAPGEIDGVLATHAHIDHTGLLPLLVRNGFRGKIYATKPTTELCDIMLRDSAHIQEFEAEWKNRKAKRAGDAPVEPMYTVQDAEAAMKLFIGVDYETKVELAPGLEIRFVDVGHLLGSSSIEIWVTENGSTTKLVFSGDIGNTNQPLIKDPAYITDADYVVMESTYGDRLHGPKPDYVAELSKILQRTFDRGGNVVIPSFAVGRTQELLYYIKRMLIEGTVPGLERVPVYLDSPLGIKATRIYENCTKENYDQEALEMSREGDLFEFPTLRIAQTAEESKQINTQPGCNIIISSSGMCDAGRIRHHLKHNLYRADSTIVFAGYQAAGTLGRLLVDGAKRVKMFGEQVIVNANIVQISGFSGHAGRDEMLQWLQKIPQKPTRVFLVHGEKDVIDGFAAAVRSLGYTVSVPELFEAFDLGTGSVHREPVVQLKRQAEASVSTMESLLSRMAKLMQLAASAQGERAQKLGADLDALLKKWD